MCAMRGRRTRGMVLLAFICVFLLVATCVNAGKKKRVNCRKYVFAPVCRGATKRDVPYPVDVNRMESAVLNFPMQDVYDTKISSPTSEQQLDWEIFDFQDLKLMKAIYKWILLNRGKPEKNVIGE